MVEPENPEYLLLGCGYTLERVAMSLPQGSFVATVRSEARAKTLGKLGIPYEFCPLDIKEFITGIFLKYPTLKVLIDSIPPMPGESASAWTIGVRNVIASLENSRLERIIYLSTSGVFGGNDGDWVDEASPANSDSPKSQARLECENLYRKSGVSTIALRIVGIYGPGRGIGLSMKHGRKVDLGPLTRWTNRIHVDDLAATITSLTLAPVSQELPEVICACDDEPVQVEVLLEYYRNLLNLPSVESHEASSSQGRPRRNLNQKVSNALMKSVTSRDLRYPSFREGAGTEFNADTDLS